MQIQLGVDLKTGEPVMLDTQTAINAHLQVSGITGMGKSHRFNALASALVVAAANTRSPLRIHVFDPHDDLEMPYSSAVKFSSATRYGYNPLEVNPDPDYGGVPRAIQKFIAALKAHSHLGPKQEAAIRYLLEDLYAARGFKVDDPSTWLPDDPRDIRAILQGREDRIYLDVTFDHKERFKSLLREHGAPGGFDDFDKDPALRSKQSWWIGANYYDGEFLMWEPKSIFKTAPTIDDAVRFVERKLKAQFCGANNAAMALLGDVNKAARAFHRKVGEMEKRGAVLPEEEKKVLLDALDKAKDKAVGVYESYLDAITTGRELDDVIRYSSTEVLMSVYERFQNARASGIYNPVPPPFDPNKPIWRYRIKPLDIPVQQMFVDLVCARIFERAMQRGLQKDVVEIIILDEGKRYLTDDDQHILNKISNEARKFGLGLWMASQTPDHFTDDFLKATGTIIVLGLSKADRNLVARKLGIEESLLSKIIPQQTAAIQVKRKGQMSWDFQMVKLA